MPMILVAVGANLPRVMGRGMECGPLALCAQAVCAIAAMPGITGAVRSGWYSSAPIPASDQPRYINGAVRLTGSIGPAALLRALHAIEAAHGRVRGMPNEARTLDLDIIDIDGLVRAAPDPVLPHPRAHLRGFVLRPLRDVAPGWVHPVSKLGIDALLAGLPPQDLRRLG